MPSLSYVWLSSLSSGPHVCMANTFPLSHLSSSFLFLHRKKWGIKTLHCMKTKPNEIGVCIQPGYLGLKLHFLATVLNFSGSPRLACDCFYLKLITRFKESSISSGKCLNSWVAMNSPRFPFLPQEAHTHPFLVSLYWVGWSPLLAFLSLWSEYPRRELLESPFQLLKYTRALSPILSLQLLFCRSADLGTLGLAAHLAQCANLSPPGLYTYSVTSHCPLMPFKSQACFYAFTSRMCMGRGLTGEYCSNPFLFLNSQ